MKTRRRGSLTKNTSADIPTGTLPKITNTVTERYVKVGSYLQQAKEALNEVDSALEGAKPDWFSFFKSSQTTQNKIIDAVRRAEAALDIVTQNHSEALVVLSTAKSSLERIQSYARPNESNNINLALDELSSLEQEQDELRLAILERKEKIAEVWNTIYSYEQSNKTGGGQSQRNTRKNRRKAKKSRKTRAWQ